MKKNIMAARMTTPHNAAMAIPATAPRLSGEELSSLSESVEHSLPEQSDDFESLDVIVTMF